MECCEWLLTTFRISYGSGQPRFETICRVTKITFLVCLHLPTQESVLKPINTYSHPTLFALPTQGNCTWALVCDTLSNNKFYSSLFFFEGTRSPFIPPFTLYTGSLATLYSSYLSLLPFRYTNLVFMHDHVGREFCGEALPCTGPPFASLSTESGFVFFYTTGSVLKAVTGLQYLPASLFIDCAQARLRPCTHQASLFLSYVPPNEQYLSPLDDASWGDTGLP